MRLLFCFNITSIFPFNLFQTQTTKKMEKKNMCVSKLLDSAKRCAVAYLEEDYIKKIIDEPLNISNSLRKFIKEELGDSSKIVFLNNVEKDTQAILWIKDKVCYLSFRGSSSTQDYIQNLKVLPVNFNGLPNAKVHKGFYEQFLSIKDEIEHYLNENSLLYNIISVSGHSLGGALAQISIPFIRDKQQDCYLICHTFGAPRTGNESFTAWLESTVNEHYRVVNKGDVVSSIPIRRVWQHSMHTCVKMDEKGNLYYPQKDVPWYSRFFTLFKSRNPTKEHMLSVYISRLESNVVIF